MARNYEDLYRAQAASAASNTLNTTISLPPGYLVGFDVRLRPDYTVLIKAGAANVGGSLVKIDVDHQLADADWKVPKINSNHLYIYLSKEGSLFVDIVDPVWNNNYLYYEQPDMGWRAIGKMMLADNNIIFAIKEVEKNEQTVTVAPAGFTGKADYYCTGTDDQILINAAIRYLHEAYNGGEVKILPGAFHMSGSVITESNILIAGESVASVFHNEHTGPTINLIGEASDRLSNITIRNIKFTNTSIATSAILDYDYIDLLTVDSCLFDSIYFCAIIQSNVNSAKDINILNNRFYKWDAGNIGVGCVLVSNGTDEAKILNNTFDGGSVAKTADACAIRALPIISGIVSGNIVSNMASASAVNVYGITGAAGVIIANNKIYNITNSNAGGSAVGIFLYGAAQSLHCNIDNNYIDTITNAASDFGGIYVSSGANYNKISANRIANCSGYGIYVGGTNNQVVSNYCFNNGADAGIANTNGDNFYDAGTDTQVYSNSWQQPVAGEPSLGTWHPTSYANRSATPFVNGTVVAVNTWSAAVTMPGVPAGARVAKCRCRRLGQTNPDALVCERATGVTLDTAAGYHYKYTGIFAPAGGPCEGMVDIPLDGSLQFKFSPLGGVTANYVYPPVAYQT